MNENLQCSPLALATRPMESDGSDGCLSRETLALIASSIGVRNVNRLKTSTMASRIHAHFGTSVGEEIKWSKEASLPQQVRILINRSYRPRQPTSWKRNTNEWLTTLDIVQVLQQYADLHKDFAFLGVHPIDFADKEPGTGQCISNSMCRVSFASLKSAGYRYAGVVFNMDVHTGIGTHWTSMFVGLDPKAGVGKRNGNQRYGVYYYDSTGQPMPLRIKRYITDFTAGVTPHPPQNSNTIRKQFRDSECGIYAIAFIVLMLENPETSFRDICQVYIQDDETMSKLRSYFFSNLS